MLRPLIYFLVVAGVSYAQPDGILKGTVKKIDAEKRTITITHDGKDRVFQIVEQTRFFGAEDKDIKGRIATIKEGAKVFFRPTRKDDREVLAGIKLDDGTPAQPAATVRKVDVATLKPLTELGAGEYHGSTGGLYPKGKNERPPTHEQAGLALAKLVQPLDASGKPSDDGKIVLLSIGMSNTSQASTAFARQLSELPDRNPALVFVNGAQGGMTAKAIQDPNDGGTGNRYWTTVDQRLKDAKVTAAQVQAVWIKQADAGPTSGFPDYAKTLQAELGKIVQVVAQRYPNVKLAYLSSRTFGGYAKTRLNPEPYAYESAFAVKWLIEDQINQNADPQSKKLRTPWLSWGPYLWANGTTKRLDGLFYDEADFGGISLLLGSWTK